MTANLPAFVEDPTDLAINQLSQKINSLPDEYRRQVAPELQRLKQSLAGRNQLQQELTERFQDVVETALDVVYRRDLQKDQYDYMSPVVENVLGFSADEMLNLSIQDVLAHLHSADRPKVAAALEQATAAGHGKLVYRFKCKDGSERWIADYVAITKDEQGQALYCTGIVRDISEQMLLQEELRKQKNLLERLVQAAPVGIAFLKGPQHVYTLVNQEYQNYARGKGELIGHTVAEKWPEIAETVLPQMNRVYETGKAFSIANAPLSIMRNGVPEESYFSYSFVPIERADGSSIEGVMILAMDTTPAVRSQQAAEAQTARLEAMLQALPVGVWITDQTGKILAKNEEADHIWAGSAPLLETVDQYPQYKAWFAESGKALTPADYPTARAVQTKMLVKATELNIERFDGTPGTVLVSAAPIYNNEGQMTGTISINLDITERKMMEETLRESEARERARAAELTATLDAVPAYVWITHDPESRQMSGNQTTYRLLRSQPGANLSKSAPLEESPRHYKAMRDGKEIPPAELPVQQAAAQGKEVRDYELDIVFEDGTCNTIIGNANPFFDEQGRPAGAVGVFVDITRLRRLEEEQISAKAHQEVQRRLMELRESERQGIARDLHDGPIQTLSSAAFNVQIVKEAFPDANLQVELEQIALAIKTGVRELRSIVNDLRPPALIRFGLAKAIQVHTEDVQERYPDIQFNLDLASGGQRFSEQACLTLFRLYQEGLNNILQHAQASRIDVRFQVRQDHFILELADNGQGFTPPQDLTQLASEGHFGLVGMKERAQTVGSELTLSSTPGQGTRIRVEGPLTFRKD